MKTLALCALVVAACTNDRPCPCPNDALRAEITVLDAKSDTLIAAPTFSQSGQVLDAQCSTAGDATCDVWLVAVPKVGAQSISVSAADYTTSSASVEVKTSDGACGCQLVETQTVAVSLQPS